MKIFHAISSKQEFHSISIPFKKMDLDGKTTKKNLFFT